MTITNKIKSAVCISLALVIVAMLPASGVERVWTGGADDGLWSSGGNWNPEGVPGADDTAVFNADSGSATVDSNYSGVVKNLTLQEGFRGTISLQRSLQVSYDYRQNGGTFTCGDNIFQIGTGSGWDQIGNFYLDAGTFIAPSTEFRWWTTSYRGVNFRIGENASWNHNNGTLSVRVYGDAYPMHFYVNGQTFNNLYFFVPDGGDGDKAVGGTLFNCYGTNTCAGDFYCGACNFRGGNSKLGGWRLLGDLILGPKGNPNNGSTEANGCFILFDSDKEQHIIGTDLDQTTGYAPGIIVNKPAGVRLTASGGAFRVMKNSGIKILSGTVDMSELDELKLVSFGTPFIVSEDAQVIWPRLVNVEGYNCKFGMTWQEFTDLRVCPGAGNGNFGIPNCSTNTVNGTLYLDGGLSPAKNVAGWPISNSSVVGEFLSKGDIAVGFGGTSSWGGGGIIHMCGSGTQNISQEGVSQGLPVVIVDKPEGSQVTCDGSLGVVNFIGQNTTGGGLRLDSGTFNFPTNRVGISGGYWGYLRQYGGKIVVPEQCVLCMDGAYPSLRLLDPIPQLRVGVESGSALKGNGLTVEAGTVTVTGTFTWSAGYISVSSGGALNLQGDWLMTSDDVKGTSCPITLAGDKVQHFRRSGGLTPGSTLTVAKTGGKFILDSDLDLTQRGSPAAGFSAATTTQSVNLQSGEVDLNGHRLILPQKGTTTVSDGFKFTFPAKTFEEGALVAAADKLKLPLNGTVNLALSGRKLDEDSATTIDVFSYGTLVNAFASTNFALEPRPDILKRYKVLHDADEKVISLAYRLCRGGMVFVR